MAKFSEILRLSQSKNGKVDNHPQGLAAKIRIRKNVLDALGESSCSVFDAFAGKGQMYSLVWKHAKRYVGCDKTVFSEDERPAFVADNIRVLRCVSLADFNVFDLDAYGSPWEQAAIIAARRTLAPGERIGVVITDGSMMKARFGGVGNAIAAMVEIRPTIRGANRRWSAVTSMALRKMARRMGAEVSAVWQAEQRSMLYTGAIFTKPPLNGAAERAAGSDILRAGISANPA